MAYIGPGVGSFDPGWLRSVLGLGAVGVSLFVLLWSLALCFGRLEARRDTAAPRRMRR